MTTLVRANGACHAATPGFARWNARKWCMRRTCLSHGGLRKAQAPRFSNALKICSPTHGTQRRDPADLLATGEGGAFALFGGHGQGTKTSRNSVSEVIRPLRAYWRRSGGTKRFTSTVHPVGHSTAPPRLHSSLAPLAQNSVLIGTEPGRDGGPGRSSGSRGRSRYGSLHGSRRRRRSSCHRGTPGERPP